MTPQVTGHGVTARVGRTALTTPAMLLVLLVAAVVASLGWGAFGGWVASSHSAAVGAMRAVDEPLSLDAQQLYASIADADVTITTAYLASSTPGLAPLRHYQDDIATAATDLARLRAGGQAPAGALGTLGRGLPAYAGYVADAESAYALGYPLTGGSFLQVASEEAHTRLLPAAKSAYDQENAQVAAASSQATGWLTLLGALAVAALTGFILYRIQRWLARRTNRLLNLGLVLASALLIASVAWLAVGFLTARGDLDRGVGQGSRPAEELAQAGIGVQQVRGDAVLNVISRSGNTSFQDDFLSTKKQVGPGPGSLLTGAAAAQPAGGTGASLVAAAERGAATWYLANAAVYPLGAQGDYGTERAMVIGTGRVPGGGSVAAGYAALESDITKAIGVDQAAFRSAATAGASALAPLEPIVIATSLLMAACCLLGFRRRLAEYR